MQLVHLPLAQITHQSGQINACGIGCGQADHHCTGGFQRRPAPGILLRAIDQHLA